MAISKDKLLEIMTGEAEAEAKANAISELVEEDLNAQLNALKVNKEEILNEKREEAAKRKAIEEQFNSLKEKTTKLEEQLKNTSPDEVRKVYEQQMAEAATIHERKLQEMSAERDSFKAQVSELEKTQLRLECIEAFNKAIQGKDVSPDSVENLSLFVLGPDCCKFAHRPVGDGKTILATKDGISIESATKAALETPFGKMCVVQANFGGGAEGGSRNSQVTINPFKKETWNMTEQGRLFKDDPEQYKRLKAEAGL